MKSIIRHLIVAGLSGIIISHSASAQRRAQPNSDLVAQRWDVEHELESVAIIERKVMMPMRDGIRLATDIYRPKDATKKVPIIFVRTPYNFNYWDIQNSAPRDLSAALTAVKRGYAYVIQNERGQFFSEGVYEILGAPLSDGYDAFTWMSSQPWSNGKIGLVGCSSTAEWQLAVVSTGHPALAAINPQGFGCGIGRIGPYYEWGNWYRGGAFQTVFLPWMYRVQNAQRPRFPAGTSQADLVRLSKYFDLAPQVPRVDWGEAIKRLPLQDIIKQLDGPQGIYADAEPIPSGGRMIQRTPGDSSWYKGGFYVEGMPFEVPSLWYVSWYDLSVGPNLALYNHVRATASPEIAKRQYLVIAPTLHCSYKRATENTTVGELSVGDARLDYDELTWSWFDLNLKGENNHLLDTLPRVRYYTLGINRWQTSDVWPPAGVKPVRFFLSSNGGANSVQGDGALAVSTPKSDRVDTFTYDPKSPVPSHGGNVTGLIPGVTPGSFDQRTIEARPDVLVYSTEPFKKGFELSGSIEVTLYFSSDVKDTDLTVKVVDVYPDGRAFNLDDTILRLRYREGYDKLVWLERGKVAKVTFPPMNTSNYFAAGHRLRIEVSSSNFPRYDRNLNTGGNNYDETESVVAHSAVHHSKEYPSEVTISALDR